MVNDMINLYRTYRVKDGQCLKYLKKSKILKEEDKIFGTYRWQGKQLEQELVVNMNIRCKMNGEVLWDIPWRGDLDAGGWPNK